MSSSRSRGEPSMRFIRKVEKEYVLTEMQEEEIKDAFDLFDFNNTNGLDPNELKEAMRALNLQPND